MKIGITCYPTCGGSGIVATELGKELAELGIPLTQVRKDDTFGTWKKQV